MEDSYPFSCSNDPLFLVAGDRSQAAFQLTANMDAEFDGLNSPKHERVAKALEQVNGFRYRMETRKLAGSHKR